MTRPPTEPGPTPEAPRILAIHAHPDDLESLCAGTLALLGRLGCPITIATMTPGDCGSAELEPEEIARVRREEARAAADSIGADYLCLEFRDLAIFNDDGSRRRVVEAIRRTRPEIVLSPPLSDDLCDHETTGRLVLDSLFAATLPNYPSRLWEPAPALARLPHLYQVDPIGGRDRDGRPAEPTLIVDVSEVFDRKQKMLACHESQRDWLRDRHGIDDSLETQAAWGRARGRQVDVEQGEAFRQHRGHPFPSDDRLAGLLASEAHPLGHGGQGET